MQRALRPLITFDWTGHLKHWVSFWLALFLGLVVFPLVLPVLYVLMATGEMIQKWRGE